MRTTIDLPTDLHREASYLAKATGKTLSQTVADLLRRALGSKEGSAGPAFAIDERTGLPVFPSTGRRITNDDVAALEDEW